MSRVQ
ncbi:hypothetical protein Patl1_24819 [Pistacia atlantica]